MDQLQTLLCIQQVDEFQMRWQNLDILIFDDKILDFQCMRFTIFKDAWNFFILDLVIQLDFVLLIKFWNLGIQTNIAFLDLMFHMDFILWDFIFQDLGICVDFIVLDFIFFGSRDPHGFCTLGFVLYLDMIFQDYILDGLI